MTSQFALFLLVQHFILFSMLKGLRCHPLISTTEVTTPSTPSAASQTLPTIFDSRVLNTVRTLFSRSIVTKAKVIGVEKGQKKSIIETSDSDKALHVKIDPHEFGQTLLNQAEENAARKSDIYMNKAIDATALGVAVLKLIFGKDAKMIMKDSRDNDVKASLRTNEFRPRTTSWSIPKQETLATGERKSFSKDDKSNLPKSDKITRLSKNILKLVKSLQPESNHRDKSRDGEKDASNDQLLNRVSAEESDPNGFSENERNVARLLSLIKETESSTRSQKGEKKSWVLLRVPTKQPSDELGMLSDPTRTEEYGNEESSHHEYQQEHRQLLHKEHRLHSTVHNKQHSNEGKSLTTSISTTLKTLKSEPVEEVNPVKTETTPKVTYRDSVNNLLKALETSTHKKSLQNEASHSVNDKPRGSLYEKVELVPLKKIEENAASKDELSNPDNTGGAVVSLDALRQLGQLLGLSTSHSDRISPYTGTKDTLTLATPVPQSALQDLVSTPAPTPAPTPPPTLSTKSNLEYSANQEMLLNRISEQLKMFAERGLRGHNEYRKLHHAEPLKWSEDLASAAEKLAYQAAKKGTTTRSELVEKKGYGENVVKISNVVLENAGEEATRHWYNEREHFTFSDPSINDKTKAFTQVIWKDTKTIGMGAAKDDDTGELYVVALYYPKGNDEGKLRENVQSDGKENMDVYASIFKKSLPNHHQN